MKRVEGIESGSVKTEVIGEHVQITLNEHDELKMTKNEFLDLVQCCVTLGTQLLQDQKEKLQEKLK
jgi:hypothetical protein